MFQRRTLLSLAALACSGLTKAATALADRFPTKPVRFVVPLSPGGSADLLARMVGEHLGQLWGQPVVIDMRPGGGTVLGTHIVAQAPADGYTLLFSANSLAINAKLRKNLPYDGLKGFEAVARMVTSPQVLAVPANSAHQDFRQWRQAAQSRTGAISVAGLGPATTQHLATLALQHAMGAQLVFVPYGGGSLAVNAALGGHVDTVLANLAEVIQHIEAGRLRALAVTTPQRLERLPQVPTVAESGYPGFEAQAWFGVSVPKGTPATVVQQLAQGIQSALNQPDNVQRLLANGLQPAFHGPAQFTQDIAQSYAHYARLIDESGFSVES